MVTQIKRGRLFKRVCTTRLVDIFVWDFENDFNRVNRGTKRFLQFRFRQRLRCSAEFFRPIRRERDKWNIKLSVKIARVTYNTHDLLINGHDTYLWFMFVPENKTVKKRFETNAAVRTRTFIFVKVSTTNEIRIWLMFEESLGKRTSETRAFDWVHGEVSE